jgi:hypothetical protein
MSEFNDQISKLVNDFVAAVSVLARRAAMETLETALGGALTGGGPRRRGRPPAAAVALPSFSAGRRAKGAKRAADEIEQTKARLYDYIKSNPGQRVEQINKALGTSTKDLALPIKKLMADKAVRSEGEKRATAYFPGDGTPTAGGGKKRGRKKRKS